MEAPEIPTLTTARLRLRGWVAERIGERLEGRIDHFGRQMFVYGLDRATYLREVAPAGVTARRAG